MFRRGSRTQYRSIREVLAKGGADETVQVKGWIRSVRRQKKIAFVQVNDGSTAESVQVVFFGKDGLALLPQEATLGACVSLEGKLVASQGGKQAWEVHPEQEMQVVGACDVESYPLQAKKHTNEFLRSIGHLRPRSLAHAAMIRVRSSAAQRLHAYLHQGGFVQVHTPVVTSSDCEGAGEMFRIEAEWMEREREGRVREAVGPSQDFFGNAATYLTVSGQLQAEMYACGMSSVYTFGPTFRAENSNTSRHLAEFSMLEPEMAFADLDDVMDLTEGMVRDVVAHVSEHNASDVALFEQQGHEGLGQRLQRLASAEFARMSYTEAIEVLQGPNVPVFEVPVSWGMDLQSEHERYLCEVHTDGVPVIVYDYPSAIKPFYMRMNVDGDGWVPGQEPKDATVASMDLLVPTIGELAGGSAREERLEWLEARMGPKLAAEMQWYLDLRRYGSVPHAGFGLGFERLVQLLTGYGNIRDCVPLARARDTCLF